MANYSPEPHLRPEARRRAGSYCWLEGLVLLRIGWHGAACGLALVGLATLAAPVFAQEAGTPGGLAPGWRWAGWLLLGLVGATGLRLAIDLATTEFRRWGSLIASVALLLCGYGIWASIHAGLSWWPPAAGLALVLLGGAPSEATTTAPSQTGAPQRPARRLVRQGPWEVFLSYKSENANLVRVVAEKLIARGARVWFAEYNVLTGNYHDFQGEIDRGIDESAFGVIFSNNQWADSPYCRLEIDRLLSRLPKERILEIAVPREAGPLEALPVLREVPSLIYDGDADKVVEFLAREAGLSLAPPPAPSHANDSAVRIFGSAGLELTLMPDVFRTYKEFGRPREGQPGSGIEDLRAWLKGNVAGLETDLFVYAWGDSTTLSELPDAPSGPLDDREAYRRLISYAGNWLARNQFNDVGLHLFFHLQQSHYAMTYIYPSPRFPGTETWERRYVITFESPRPGQRGEIILVFTTHLPEELPDEDALTRWCQAAPEFEAIAASLNGGYCLY